LRDGQVVSADESPPEPFGSSLVRSRVLTIQQCSAIGARVPESASSILAFLQAATQAGFLTSEQANAALRDHARWCIVFLLRRDDPQWQLAQGVANLQGVTEFNLQLEPLVLFAARTAPPWETKDPLIVQHADRYPRLVATPEHTVARFGLAGQELSVLVRLDGATKLGEIATWAVAHNIDVRAVFSALIVTRALELREAIDAPPLSASSPAISRPPASLSPSSVGPVPQRPSSPTAPAADRDAPPSSRLVAEALAAGSGEAKQARAAFSEAKTFLRSNLYADALSAARRAQSLDANPTYELYVLWLEACIRSTEPDSASLAILKGAATTALRHDPKLAHAAYVIGYAASLEDHKSDAIRWLNRALQLDPSHAEAAEELRALEVKSSGVGRFFSAFRRR
jgi:tetratricopeptide (TPR) repeat protein